MKTLLYFDWEKTVLEKIWETYWNKTKKNIESLINTLISRNWEPDNVYFKKIRWTKVFEIKNKIDWWELRVIYYWNKEWKLILVCNFFDKPKVYNKKKETNDVNNEYIIKAKECEKIVDNKNSNFKEYISN